MCTFIFAMKFCALVHRGFTSSPASASPAWTSTSASTDTVGSTCISTSPVFLAPALGAGIHDLAAGHCILGSIPARLHHTPCTGSILQPRLQTQGAWADIRISLHTHEPSWQLWSPLQWSRPPEADAFTDPILER